MIHRTDVPWNRPLLPQAARLLVEHYAAETRRTGDGSEARMAGAVVVLPGSRAGRRLKELLVEASVEAGVRLVPPRIVTQGILPDLLREPRRPVASGPVLRLVWAEALREAASSPGEREALTRIFAALPASAARSGRASTLSDWTPLARELQRLARSVAAGGYRFREVADRCGGSLLYDDAPRWRALARVQDRVERRLEALGLEDRDLARMAALDEGAVVLPGDVWLVGVPELPGVVRRMLVEAGGGTLRTVVHAPSAQGDEALFDPLGCIRPEAWSVWRVPLPDHRIRMVDRPAQQADEVAAILAELGGAHASDDIAIGVPSPEVIPALEQRLPRSGVAVRPAAGMALSASGPFRLLRAVADFLSDRRYEILAALVRHPDLTPALEAAEGEASLETDWLTSLDRWYGEHLPGDLSRGLSGAGSNHGATARAVLDRVDELLAPLSGDQRPLSRWVEPALRFLAGVYRFHALSPDRERHRALLRALEEIRWCAETLTGIPGPLDAPCNAATALRFLLEEAASVRLPVPARDDALEMLGWLELHLDDAPVAIVTGVNEGALPESVRGDAFLPDALRRILGLEDNRQRHARDVYRLAAILHSREVLYLVAGRRTAEGDPLRPSRLLFAADEETVALRVRRFYADAGEPQLAPGGTEATGALEGTGPAAGFALPPEELIPLDPFPATLAVTDFARILADPYEWALKRTRGLKILEDRALEMDGAAFGDLAHEVLRAFGQEEVARHAAGAVLTSSDQVWREIEPILDRFVGGRFGPGASRARVAVRLQVEQLRSRLRAFADWHARWVSEGWRVKAAEIATPEETGVPFPCGDGAPLVGLVARIDRVDHHPGSGSWAVFDYKTSDAGEAPDKTHRKGSGTSKEWKDLQLPLYHWLATRLQHADGTTLVPSEARDAVEVGYILLPRGLEKVGASMATWTPEELAGAVERAQEVVRGLAEGPVRFDPDARPRYPEDQMEALAGRSILAGDEEDPEDDV